MRVKEATFGAIAAVLAVGWLLAAIRIWPAIAPAPRPAVTPRPSTEVDVPRVTGRIAVAAEGDILLIRDGRLSPHLSGDGRRDPALSADGERLAYSVRSAIDGKRTVDGHVVPAHLEHSSIVVRSTAGGSEEILVNGLQRRDPNGFHLVEFETQPAWSADGSALAFISDNGQGAHLQTYTFATKRILTLSSGTTILADPAWSPDGKTIAATSYTTGTPGILLVPANGTSQARRLKLAREGDPYRPSFSPDGKWLLLTVRGERGNDVVAVELATERIVDLTADGKSWGGVFSPDGASVAFLRERGGEIDLFVLEVADTLRTGATPKAATQLTRDGRLDGASRPSWSR